MLYAAAGVAAVALATCRAYDRDAYANLLDSTAEPVDAPFDANDVEIADASDAPEAGLDAALDSSCVPARLGDFCMVLPPLPTNPVIDGLLDCGPPLIPLSANAWSNSAQAVPGDVSASYAIAWRPDGLYIFIHVATPRIAPAPPTETVWCGDGVEIYVDADGTYGSAPLLDNPGAVHIVVNAPTTSTVRRTEVVRGDGGFMPYSTLQAVSVLVTDGYNLEAFVSAADLNIASWTLAGASRLGFDLAVNVSVPPGGTPFITSFCSHYYGQFVLHIAPSSSGCTTGSPACNVHALCNPTLTP